MNRWTRAKVALVPLLALFSLPMVLARDLNLGFGTGNLGTATGKILEIIGSIFNFNMSAQTQLGLLKFMFFLMVFAIAFWSARRTVFSDEKGNAMVNKRTAAIISFCMAAISVWFLPNETLMDVTSIIPALFVLMLILFVPAFLVWGAFASLGGDKDKPGAVRHALGLLLVGLAWGWVLFWYTRVGMGAAPGQYHNIIDIVLSWVLLALPILFIVKLFQVFMHAAGGASGVAGSVKGLSDWWKNRDLNKEEEKNRRMKREADISDERTQLQKRLKKPSNNWPSPVNKIEFIEDPTNPAQTLVKWEPNPDSEGVNNYHIFVSTRPVPTGTAANTVNVRDPASGYVYVSSTTSPKATISSGLPPRGTSIHFAIQAENAKGLGTCGFSGYGPVKSTPPPPPPNTDDLNQKIADASSQLLQAEPKIMDAFHALTALRVYDPTTGSPTSPRFPLVQASHPEWGTAGAAIHQYKEVAGHLFNAGTLLSQVAGDGRFKTTTTLHAPHMALMKDLARFRIDASVIKSCILYATGVNP